jgi:glycosyltransferase 2 family protein
MWKRVGAVVVSVTVSAVFLWWALRGIQLGEVWGDIQHASVFWLVLSFLIGLVGIYTRGIRWRGLVDFKVTRAQGFYIVGIMMMLNLFMRLGEVARTVLARREKIPVVTAATSIVVERLLDTVFVLIVLAVVVSRVPNMPPEVAANVARVAPIFAGLAMTAFLTMVLLARYPQFAHRLLHITTDWLPFLKRLPLDELLDHLLQGLKPLVEWRSFAHAVGWTLISWALSYIVFMMVQYAFGLPDNLVLQSGLGMSLASFSVALPSVGAIGVFQLALITAGQAFYVDEATGLAIGVVIHAITILIYITTGLWGFIGMGVAMTDVVQSRKQESAASS